MFRYLSVAVAVPYLLKTINSLSTGKFLMVLRKEGLCFLHSFRCLFLLLELSSKVLHEFPLNFDLFVSVVLRCEPHPAYANFVLFGGGRLLCARRTRCRRVVESLVSAGGNSCRTWTIRWLHCQREISDDHGLADRCQRWPQAVSQTHHCCRARKVELIPGPSAA